MFTLVLLHSRPSLLAMLFLTGLMEAVNSQTTYNGEDIQVSDVACFTAAEVISIVMLLF